MDGASKINVFTVETSDYFLIFGYKIICKAFRENKRIMTCEFGRKGKDFIPLQKLVFVA